ncbi:hypothetical protein AVEN_232168-1 [Araneus ventricosus]|uniref:Transposase Tc1-like domain-containing protein n=1 Tax=Araneus ventricosus TaxID=182803 RepID=A0A4Y2IYX4_ARAVE|nr:hypothetical protein AVEN_206695-1 [Araneus ventricosus]GBM82830.1 hypothetical protein AVEN_232168-1 [Araneus ventricosus]
MGKVQDHPRISDPQVAADLKTDYNNEVTPRPVRKVIKAGYNGRAARKKPCKRRKRVSVKFWTKSVYGKSVCGHVNTITQKLE